MAPALPFDPVVGQQQGKDEMCCQQGRRRQREKVPETQRRGGCIEQDHAGQSAQPGQQVVADRLEAIDQHGADHGQAAGEGDCLPQQHGRKR